MVKQPLRVLQINATDITGGAAKVAWNLFQGCRQHGCDSWLAVGHKRSYDSNVLAIQNDRFRSRWANYNGRLSRILQWFAEPRRHIESYMGIEDFNYPGTHHLLELLPDKPDILHCHNLHGGYFDLRVIPGLSQNLSTILTLHDAWLMTGHCAHSFDCQRWKVGCGHCPDLSIYPAVKADATAYNWRRKRNIYSKSKLYVATPSKWLMEKVKQSILAPAILESKIIPNGIDLSVFHPQDKQQSRCKLKLPQDADILLFVSQGIKRSLWRDYNLLEETIYKLSQVQRSKLLLMICLGEEAEPKNFKNAEIRFIPPQEDEEIIANYYQASDVYLHPAKEETYPLVILEALACGTPVVSTLVGGIPEEVESGKNGFLVPLGDVLQLVSRVTQLLDDRILWNSFSQRAIEVACKRFDFNYQVQTYLNWYKEIIEKYHSHKKELENN